MTVTSLWSSLDQAGSATRVGAKELLSYHGSTCSQDASGVCIEHASRANGPTFAIDLSIWICEALTSEGIRHNHGEPALYLVYTRTLKLLKLGIKLVAVIEGQHQNRGGPLGLVKTSRNRSGAPFWKACKKCRHMLELLGVIVVQAQAEAEALCALLNDWGIVDAVISNDGDCFLYGAKVLYTKFTVDNLVNGQVRRYEASKLQACLEVDDTNETERRLNCLYDKEQTYLVQLTREDLIAFAIIAGSDVAHVGISKVGCQKSLRFVQKCKLDNPLYANGAALRELLSWAKSTPVGDLSKQVCSGQCCTICGHSGTKKSHRKDGCEECGTGPGESCYPMSPGAKFRKSLRSKVMNRRDTFDPIAVAACYESPNENTIPNRLVSKKSKDLRMQSPKIRALLESSLIIRGRNCNESRNFLIKSLAPLLATLEISLRSLNSTSSKEELTQSPRTPSAKRIVKTCRRGTVSCFQVAWELEVGGMEDCDSLNNGIYQFETIEPERIIRKSFPQLLEQHVPDGCTKQGEGEQDRRRKFIQTMLGGTRKASLKRDEAKRSSGFRGVFRAGKTNDDRRDAKASCTLEAQESKARAPIEFVDWNSDLGRKRSTEQAGDVSISSLTQSTGWPNKQLSSSRHARSADESESPYRISKVSGYEYFLDNRQNTAPTECDVDRESRKMESIRGESGSRRKRKLEGVEEHIRDVPRYDSKEQSERCRTTIGSFGVEGEPKFCTQMADRQQPQRRVQFCPGPNPRSDSMHAALLAIQSPHPNRFSAPDRAIFNEHEPKRPHACLDQSPCFHSEAARKETLLSDRDETMFGVNELDYISDPNRAYCNDPELERDHHQKSCLHEEFDKMETRTKYQGRRNRLPTDLAEAEAYTNRNHHSGNPVEIYHKRSSPSSSFDAWHNRRQVDDGWEARDIDHLFPEEYGQAESSFTLMDQKSVHEEFDKIETRTKHRGRKIRLPTDLAEADAHANRNHHRGNSVELYDKHSSRSSSFDAWHKRCQVDDGSEARDIDHLLPEEYGKAELSLVRKPGIFRNSDDRDVMRETYCSVVPRHSDWERNRSEIRFMEERDESLDLCHLYSEECKREEAFRVAEWTLEPLDVASIPDTKEDNSKMEIYQPAGNLQWKDTLRLEDMGSRTRINWVQAFREELIEPGDNIWELARRKVEERTRAAAIRQDTGCQLYR